MFPMIQAMRVPVAPATPLSRFTFWNGLIYLPTGFLFLLFPQVLELTGYPPLGDAAGPIRGVGLCVIYIGSFYLWGARSRFTPLALATVFNRVFVGPLLILPLVYFKLMHPLLGIPFMLLDMVLGGAMYVIWKRTEGAARD
jgi:hypothetical protein